MARFSFDLDTVKLEKSIKELSPKAEQYIDMSVKFAAQKGVAEMKQNAPWTDRTTNARNGLFTVPNKSQNGKSWEILFSHAVPYGIWLEVCNNGRYQIIMPTVKNVGEQLMQHLQMMFKEMK